MAETMRETSKVVVAEPLRLRRKGSRSAAGEARLGVASRVIAALAGGYALTSLFATALALLSRAPREEAILAATTPSYLASAAAIIWAFVAPTATKAWLGLGLPGLLLAVLVWRLRFAA